MKKRILALLSAGLVLFALAACGSQSAPASTNGAAGEPAESAEPGESSQPAEPAQPAGPAGAGGAASDLKIGLILAGEEADACSKNYVEGMRAACEKLGIDYDSQVMVKTNVGADSTCGDAIAQLCEAGYQAVFADPFGHEAYMMEAAAKYPEVQFCCAAGSRSAADERENTHSYFAKIHQARYLAGIAAGLKTESNLIGYVATTPSPEVISGYTAFYLGAKSVNPQVTMLVNYTGEWSDAAKEAANAQALIDRGCDVLSQHSDTSASVLAAQSSGVFAVGCNEDMMPFAPDAALLSARVDWGVYYEYALDCLTGGKEIPQDWCGDYSGGACYLSPLNEDIAAEGTADAIEAAASGINDGSVQVFAGPLHGVDGEGKELNLAEGEAYTENETSSAPAFAYLIDGITVLS